jgi:hypothetical protein
MADIPIASVYRHPPASATGKRFAGIHMKVLSHTSLLAPRTRVADQWCSAQTAWGWGHLPAHCLTFPPGPLQSGGTADAAERVACLADAGHWVAQLQHCQLC